MWCDAVVPCRCGTVLLTDGNRMFMFHSPDGASEPITSLDAERLAHSVNNTVRAVTPRLKDFHQILHDPPKVSRSMDLQRSALSRVCHASDGSCYGQAR